MNFPHPLVDKGVEIFEEEGSRFLVKIWGEGMGNLFMGFVCKNRDKPCFSLVMYGFCSFNVLYSNFKYQPGVANKGFCTIKHIAL